MQSGLDGRSAQSQNVGGLLGGETLHIAEQEDRLVLAVQAVDRGQDQRAALLLQDRIGGLLGPVDHLGGYLALVVECRHPLVQRHFG